MGRGRGVRQEAQPAVPGPHPDGTQPDSVHRVRPELPQQVRGVGCGRHVQGPGEEHPQARGDSSGYRTRGNGN